MTCCTKSLYYSHCSLLELEQTPCRSLSSPAAEDGEDDDLGVSDDSGYMKSREESSELPSGHSLPKSDGNI